MSGGFGKQVPPGVDAGVPLPAEIAWHLSTAASAVRLEPTPLDPAVLRALLRGLTEFCGLLIERGGEAPARPPLLFRDNEDSRALMEALGLWDIRIRTALTSQDSRELTRATDHVDRATLAAMRPGAGVEGGEMRTRKVVAN